MAFNEQEKQIILYGKQNGKTQQEVEQAIVRLRTGNPVTPIGETPQEKGPGILSRALTNVKKFATGVKDVILKQSDELGQDVQSIAGEDANLGIRDIPKVALAVAGKTGKAVGGIVGAGLEAAGKTLLTNEQKDTIKNSIASAIQTTTGKKVVGTFEEVTKMYDSWAKKNPRAARNLSNTLGVADLALTLTGIGAAEKGAAAAARTGEKALAAGAKIAEETVATGKKAVQTAIKAGEEVAGKAKQVIDPITGELKRIPARIAINAAEKQATEQAIKNIASDVSKIANGVKNPSLVTEAAQTAARDGIQMGDVKTILTNAAKKVNKPAIRELVDTAKKFASGVTETHPFEVVGKPIVAGIKKAESLRGVVGAKLGKIAETLGKVSEQELRPAVLAELKKVPGLAGLKTTMNGVLDFKDTVLSTALSKSDRMAVRKIFDEAVRSGTGKSKHLLRQELFEILGGAKRSSQAITATQEKAFEAVRKGLSNVLETKSSGYKALNQKFAQVVKPLGEMRKLMKVGGVAADEDILNMSAGLLARRLTGFSASNPQVRNVLRSIDTVLQATGKGTEASTAALQDVYNVLNRYYNLAGGTSFEGGVKAGVEKGVGGVMKMANYVVDQTVGLAGETKAVRQKALEKLLEELLR